MKKITLKKIIALTVITLIIGASIPGVIGSEGTQNALDEEPPQISEVIADPETQTEGGSVNISCNVTDNVAVALVKANITYPDASIQNETMLFDNVTNIAFYNTTYSMIGEYTFFIWANDTSDNRNQTEAFNFTIEEEENNPPNLPSNPSPSNEATGVATDTILSWDGGDPNGDIVYYDVFLGLNETPPLVSQDQLNTTYDPDLAPSTTYYWQIIATDEHGSTALGDLWSFTTASSSSITCEITFPDGPGFYRNDRKLFNFPRNRIFVYGPLTIVADAYSDAGIDKVVLWRGDRQYEVDETAPYIFNYSGIRSLISGSITLTVEAIDNNQEKASDQIQIIKWRIHPALIATGTLVALKGVANIALGRPAFGWTIIRGTALNIREQGNNLIFRAMHLHYTEITGSSFNSGTIRSKKVRISDVGFNRMFTLGPFGSLNYIFAISHGNIQELT